VSLAWLVTGKTVGGLNLYPQRNCLNRETALRMWTENVTWFSNEEGRKGRVAVGQFADIVVPSRDYFTCSENDIADITSDLTLVGGRVVYGANDFARFDGAPPPPAMPDWSPVRAFGGYGAWGSSKAEQLKAMSAACDCARACNIHGHAHVGTWANSVPADDLISFWGALGCACWAV
jgi:hypothetical protein